VATKSLRPSLSIHQKCPSAGDGGGVCHPQHRPRDISMKSVREVGNKAISLALGFSDQGGYFVVLLSCRRRLNTDPLSPAGSRDPRNSSASRRL
jgi:hypothetical protein